MTRCEEPGSSRPCLSTGHRIASTWKTRGGDAMLPASPPALSTVTPLERTAHPLSQYRASHSARVGRSLGYHLPLELVSRLNRPLLPPLLCLFLPPFPPESSPPPPLAPFPTLPLDPNW
eukprot:2059378-Rhodomonas_salina.2